MCQSIKSNKDFGRKAQRILSVIYEDTHGVLPSLLLSPILVTMQASQTFFGRLKEFLLLVIFSSIFLGQLVPVPVPY